MMQATRKTLWCELQEDKNVVMWATSTRIHDDTKKVHLLYMIYEPSTTSLQYSLWFVEEDEEYLVKFEAF